MSTERRGNTFLVKVWETSKEVKLEEEHPGDSFDKRNPSSKSEVGGDACCHHEYCMCQGRK